MLSIFVYLLAAMLRDFALILCGTDEEPYHMSEYSPHPGKVQPNCALTLKSSLTNTDALLVLPRLSAVIAFLLSNVWTFVYDMFAVFFF